MSGRIESLMTPAAPKHRLPITIPTAASTQLSPVAKKIRAAKNAPVQAKNASMPFLFAVRSAKAPSGGSSSADRIVEAVISQKNREPGGMEKGPMSKRPFSPTAFSARLMKYGPKKTVPMVVV